VVARAALARALAELAEVAAGGPWNIAWCAGGGVVSTAEETLAAEARQFTAFLHDIGGSPLSLPDGALLVASSAGGVYAGSSSRPPYTESSPTGPLVAYGRLKLTMEDAVRAFADKTGSAALIARIANLYGPGQDLGKPQGLVSQLCRAEVTGDPVVVYVPLDTMRDYVFVDDCADLLAAGLLQLRDRVRDLESRVVIKIVASGQCTTISSLIAEVGRQYKKRPRVVVKAPVEGSGQVVDLRLRSTVWTDLDAYLRTPIHLGVARTARDVGEQIHLPNRARQQRDGGSRG
jgi:UDP-glucose 4-epimerase